MLINNITEFAFIIIVYKDLKSVLENQNIQKILNFQENVDFIIQIDNVDSFDSINLGINFILVYLEFLIG